MTSPRAFLIDYPFRHLQGWLDFQVSNGSFPLMVAVISTLTILQFSVWRNSEETSGSFHTNLGNSSH